MITTAIFYGIKCDRCGEQYEDGNDHTHWPDEESAIEFAINYDEEGGWIEREGKHYCPGCYTIDEETQEEVLSRPIPEHIKKICAFIEKVVGAYVYIKEEPELFRMEYHPYGLPTNPCVEQFIRDYLGDKLTSIVYAGDFMSNDCFIEIKK